MTDEELIVAQSESIKKIRKKFPYKDRFVCGSIDFSGHVSGHQGLYHSPLERSGCTWRWDIHEQAILNDFIPQPRKLSTDDISRIHDWLYDRGYATQESVILNARLIKKAQDENVF